MKLVYASTGHVLDFDKGLVNELIVENKKLFFEMVNSISMQADGLHGGWLLSMADKPMEFSRYVDLSVQFAPFQINRKSLLSKLYVSLEQKSVLPENYVNSMQLLGDLERYLLQLAQDFPFELHFQKLAMGPIIRAISPEIDEEEKSAIEKVFAYMEMVRELDRDRLFIMINMRSYFSDEDMETLIESVCLHDFKMLLVESTERNRLKNTNRYVIDDDLCEF